MTQITVGKKIGEILKEERGERDEDRKEVIPS